MKRLRKRMTALLLSCLLSFSCVACSYENVNATGLEVPAAYGALQVLEAILLSFGISVVTLDMISNAANSSWWDGTGALQPTQDMYDELEAEYNRARFQVINGSGGENPDPTPIPAITGEPEPVPTPVEEIPTFQELTEEASSKGFLELTAGAFGVLASAVSKLWDDIIETDEAISDAKNTFSNKNLIGTYTLTYRCSQLGGFNRKNTVYLYDPYSVITKLIANGTTSEGNTIHNIYCSGASGSNLGCFIVTDTFFDSGSVSRSTYRNTTQFYKDTLPSGSSSCVETFDFYIPYSVDGVDYEPNVKPIFKEEIWVHPDLQDTYQNNGKLEYPQQAPQPLTIPSIQQLQDLAKKLNPEINPEYSPEIAPNYIKELIEQLQREPSVDPDPGIDPNPNPDPNPDPDPDVTPDPDEPGVDDGDPVKDYKTDLRQIFPFCIPFDLINLLDALDAEPVAPKFEIPVDIEVNNPFTKTKILDYHNVIVIDLSVYEDAVKVVRIFEILFFILGLLLITRQQMIKG